MASSVHKLNQGEAKQILVQLGDGSTWKAEIQDDGTTLLTEQLTSPTSPQTSPEPAPELEQDEMEQDSPEPAEAQEGTAGEATQHQPDQEETLDEMFQNMGKGQTIDKILGDIPDVHGMPDDIKEKIKDPAFRSKLSSIMLDNKYDRKLRGRTRGKLDMARLPKVPMLQRNVFTKKQSRRGKNYNVTILVDQSGSMSGAKSKKAAELAIFLLKSFDGININTSVIGFHDNIHVDKDWNSKKKYDTVYKNLLRRGGGNQDYDAMHFALEHFNKAPEGENILLMLSDGAPTQSGRTRVINEDGTENYKFKFHPASLHGEKYAWDDDDDEDSYNDDWKNDREYLHHLVESYPNVHAIGIGIFEGGWQIPEHFIVHSLEDLKPMVIKTLSNKIKRG